MYGFMRGFCGWLIFVGKNIVFLIVFDCWLYDNIVLIDGLKYWQNKTNKGNLRKETKNGKQRKQNKRTKQTRDGRNTTVGLTNKER